ARVVLGHRLLEDDRQLPVNLALARCGAAIGPLPIARLLAIPAILARDFLAFFLRLRLVFFRLLLGLLLGAGFDLPPLGLFGLLSLLGFLDDSLDHLLERSLGDTVLLGGTVEVEHPLDRRQSGQPLDLDLEAARAFVVRYGEGDDRGRAATLGAVVTVVI